MSPFATNPGDETMTVTIAPSGGTTKSFRPDDDPSLGPRVIATMRLSGRSVSHPFRHLGMQVSGPG